MRPITLLCMLVLWTPLSSAQTYDPYAHLTRHDQILSIQFSQTASMTEIEAVMERYGLSFDSMGFERWWFVWTNGQPATTMMPELNTLALVHYANPVFTNPGTDGPLYITYSDELVVKFHDHVSDTEITAVNRRLSTVRIRQITGGDWVLRVVHPKVRDAIATTALYNQEPTVYSAFVNTRWTPYELRHVRIGTFTATEDRGVVTLRWTLSSDHTTAEFLVSRSRFLDAGFEPFHPLPLTGPTAFEYLDSEVQVGQVYYYLLTAMNAGTIVRMGPTTVRVTSPSGFALHQNHPNPFNAETTIRFDLPMPSTVTLQIYNTLGQDVLTVINQEIKPAGFYTIRWDGRDQSGKPVASGTYIYRLEAGSFRAAQKMTLLK